MPLYSRTVCNLYVSPLIRCTLGLWNGFLHAKARNCDNCCKRDLNVQILRKMFLMCVFPYTRPTLTNNRAGNRNDHAEISFPYNLFISFCFSLLLFGNTIHKIAGIPSGWFNAMTLTSLAQAVQSVAFIFFRLQVPKNHESLKKIVYANNITPKRSAAYIPVWIFWPYTSVQLHTDSTGELISLVWPGYQYSTRLQKNHKDTVDLNWNMR